MAKDAERFPGFDPAVVADLRTSLDLFLDTRPEPGFRFRKLLLADDLYLDGRLARFLGTRPPTDATFQKVKLSHKERAGVLTHPYLMAVFANRGNSPIHRGVFLAQGVLGVTLRPPRKPLRPLPKTRPILTTGTERVGLQTKGTMPVVPRRHQPAWVYARTFRRGRPLSGPGQRQAHRFDGVHQTRTGQKRGSAPGRKPGGISGRQR